MLGYTVRITGYAGARFVKVHVWLENHGATGFYLPKDFNRTRRSRHLAQRRVVQRSTGWRSNLQA